MQNICSRVRPRPLFLKNCNQRFEPLAKRVALVSLYQNIDPTKCLRNQCNWRPLISASPHLNKIFVRRKTFTDLVSFRPFLQVDCWEPLFRPTKGKRLLSI